MRRRHRILHLITRLELGGAQQNTLFCVERHDRERFEVELMAGAGGMLDEEARNIPDAAVKLVPWLRHPIAPLHDIAALLRLRRHFKEAGIELVHTHSSKAGLLGRLAAALAGVPVILHTAHGWSFNDTQPRWKRALYVALERLAARFSTRLIVVSSRDREKGLRLGIGRPEQYEIIHSGIDAELFSTPDRPGESVRAALGFEPSHKVVGTIACLKPQKAPLDFVRAAAAAHSEDDNLRFFIAGDGELRPQLTALVKELGLQEVVRLLGWRRDVTDLLHAMDLFLLPSLFEGLPRSVLQAMAAGVPVVATAVDGTPEVIEDGVTGLLTPPGNPEVAARRVIEMLENDELRESCVMQARSRLSSEFDIHQMVRDLDRLYAGLLEEE
jgi:glycosyltransferase involved in cell wall biosynthesis